MGQLSTTFLASGIWSATIVLGAVLKNRASSISVSNTTLLGYMHDADFNPAIYRDCGGGGLTGSGYHVIGFCDSQTYGKPPYGSGTFEVAGNVKNDGQGIHSFVHNTFALSAAYDSDPSRLLDFGDYTYIYQNGNFTTTPYKGQNGGWGTIGPVTDAEAAMGGKFAIWPNSNMLGSKQVSSLASNQLIGVFPAVNLTNTSAIFTMYNTLTTLTVSKGLNSGQNLPAVRNVSQLFQRNEPQYGSHSLYSAGTPGDGYLYLTAAVNSNAIKVARVPWGSMTTRSAYTFYNGKSWVSQIPSVDDTASNIYTFGDGRSLAGGIVGGELFWSSYYNSYALSFGWLGTIYMTLANNPTDITQGFNTNPTSIYSISVADNEQKVYTYAYHSYADYDTTGKTLLLSWSQGVAYPRMARVQFA